MYSKELGMCSQLGPQKAHHFTFSPKLVIICHWFFVQFAFFRLFEERFRRPFEKYS